MKKIGFNLPTVLGLAMVASVAVASVPAVFAQDTAVTAIRVTTDVSNPLDAAWNATTPLSITLDAEVPDEELPTVGTTHFGPLTELSLQAAYDDNTVWIRAIWPDDTMNTNMLYWTYDGTAWSQSKLRQDRISFLFDISGNAQFKALGCGAVCHTADANAGDYMGFPAGSTDTVDSWQWKSSQTALVGYADDQWLGAYVDDKGPKTPSNDASEGNKASASNKNEAGDAPAFMYPEGVTSGPLFADVAVPFDPAVKFEAGTTIPGYVVSRPGGSRGDVNASSMYVKDLTGKGWWYVVLSRALTTGNAEDHVFTLESSNVFGVALFNSADDKEHTTNDKLTLEIGK